MTEFTILRCSTLPAHLYTDAELLYQRAFAPLMARAAMRHLMTSAEFTALDRDDRVTKIVAFDGDKLVGLSTVTDHLDAVPLISPPYFARNWPAEYAARRIWYVPFMCTDRKTPGVFRALLLETSARARQSGGLVFMDFAQVNVDRHLPGHAAHMLGEVDETTHNRCVDAQHVWQFSFDGEDTPR